MTTVLGVDFGGSGIKGAPVDVETGELIAERFRLPTPEDGSPQDVAEVISAIVRHFDLPGPVGVGFPAVILNGVAYSAANISSEWVDTNAQLIFSNTTGHPVYVVNDADAAGMAELRFGAGRDQQGVIIMLTLGTGIGSAIFTDGVLVPNTEFGHMKIRGKDAEKRASDAARDRRGYTWQQWAERLQEFLEEMEKLFSPNMFIIGGGISKDYSRYFPYLSTRAKLVPAQLLNQAGIVGAALYAEQQDKLNKA